MLTVFGSFVSWPIFLGDTDIWYHMNGGRYLVETGTIPTTSFFSFIDPPKTWHNYYWLFQGLVFWLFTHGAYYALVVFRAVMVTATAILVYRIAFSQRDGHPQLLYYSAIVLLIVVALVPRSLLVRPHLFSYLFIAFFLWVLERHRKSAWLLPPVALLWVNFHGIEFPVMILISVAYLCDAFWERRRADAFSKETYRWLVPVILAMWAVFLTPNGWHILNVPFKPAQHAFDYIREMKPITKEHLLNVSFYNFVPTGFTANNIVLLMGAVACLGCLRRGRFRPGPIVMYIGGLYLMTRGVRFYNEAALLTLPVLRHYPLPRLITVSEHGRPGLGFLLLASLLFVSPLNYFREVLPNALKYPLSKKGLPAGVTKFLRVVDTGGTILNWPATGGYTQWRLYPRYRIFLDLEMMFSESDYYIASSAFANPAALGRFLSKYSPDYISVDIRQRAFATLIAPHKRYVAVFFDDAEVLYVNRERFPQVAARYEFKAVDPFKMEGMDLNAVSDEEQRKWLRELYRVDVVYPHVAAVNQVIAMMKNRAGDYVTGALYASDIVEHSPERAKGFRLAADALLGQKRYREALKVLKEAQKRTGEDKGQERRSLDKKIWFAHRQLGDHKAAYKAIRGAVSLFSPATTAEDLYRYAITALDAGETTEAQQVFHMALLKVPSDDEEGRQEIEKQLSRFLDADAADPR